MFRCFYLLLLVCLVYHNGNTDIPVSGKKGGNVTFTCEFEANKIDQVDLFSEAGDTDVCQTEECSGRVFKQGNCDVVIKNLSFSDAGKYTLRVHYKNDQTNPAQDRKYQLHIDDEISVKAGKPLKMHVLMSNADKVEKSSSEGWKKVWKRGHGVWSDRMNVSDGDLIIKAFMDNDAGTYRVLDSEGEILITVTVTESGTKSTGKQDTDKDKTGDTEEHAVEKWILSVGVCSGILVLAVIGVVICRCRRTGYTQTPVQENLEPPEVPLTILTEHDETAQGP